MHVNLLRTISMRDPTYIRIYIEFFLCLNLSLGHLFTEMYNATKRWPSDKFKEKFKTYLKVHCYATIIKCDWICENRPYWHNN